MNNTPGFVDNYLAYLLARASHLISSEFHAKVEANGLSLMEWRIMASLSGKTALRVGELADIVLSKQPTVTKLIGRMAEAGWVKRVDAAHDKRQSLVSLSAKGSRKIKPLLSQAQTHEIQVLSELDSAEVDQLKGLLKHMIVSRKLALDVIHR